MGVPGTNEGGFNGDMITVRGGNSNVTNSNDNSSLGGRRVDISIKQATNLGQTKSVAPSLAALHRYIYWSEEEATKALPDKSSVSDARKMAPLASPVSVVDQKKVAPAASQNSVANCETFSLSEGLDLFKAICDLAHSR